MRVVQKRENVTIEITLYHTIKWVGILTDYSIQIKTHNDILLG